jgi:hypothetical protein
MATVIDTIAGADGRTVEITVEPGEIALVVRSPDHERPERAVLSWDEFDAATDKLRAWRRLVAPPAPTGPAESADPSSAAATLPLRRVDEIASFVAALAGE